MKYSLIYLFAILCFVSCDKAKHEDTVGPNIPSVDSLQVYLDKANKGDIEAKFISGILLQSKQSKQDSIKASEYFNSAAELGYSPAERAIAYELLDSTSSKYNLNKGIEMLESSAKHGHLRAKLELSNYYFEGRGVDVNNDKALQLINDGLTGLFSLAKKGNSKAQWVLGQLFVTGSYLPQNHEQGKLWLKKSADSNNAYGQFLYGTCFMNDNIKDYSSAFYWINEANKKKLPESYPVLAELYKNGFGTSQDINKAFELNLEGAQLGDQTAMFNVAYSYGQGQGIEANQSEAFKWYKKLADAGNIAAQNNIGAMYQNGTGVSKDASEAFKWYMKSARGGNSLAECNVGRCYASGEGVEKDLTEAVKWFSKSAEHGNPQGFSALAYCYAYGLGVAKDLSKAAYWQDKANIR